MTNLAEQAQEGATRSQTMAAARSPRVRDAIKVDRSIKPTSVIETPAMVIKRSMQQANKKVGHSHDEDCVCVWHVIRRLYDSAALTMRLQTDGFRKGGRSDREPTREGFGESYANAYANTRERIKAEASAREPQPPAPEPTKKDGLDSAATATGAASIKGRPAAARRQASMGID